MKKLKTLLKHFAALDKENGIYPSNGESALARELGLNSPMVIRGWLSRNKIPDWRVSDVDVLFLKIDK